MPPGRSRLSGPGLFSVRSRRAWLPAAAAVVSLAVFAATGRPWGEVLFTGLDDSAQSILARAFKGEGAALAFRDDAFAAVPGDARADLLYRPGGRLTRDLAHQVDPVTFEARPFFQPFLPLQRAFLPRLPFVLALAVIGAVAAGPGRVLLPRLTANGGKSSGRSFAEAATSALAVAAAAALTPWHSPVYLAGPFAEGPATLFAALAMALAFAPGGGAARGFGVGLPLGLAVSFHPTLSAFAVPIAAFSVMRSGRMRNAAGFAAGAVAGLAPMVWSTLCLTAPYGNFFSLPVLRRMIAESRDIAALAVALAVAVPVGVAFAAAALSPCVRRFFERPRVRVAVAAASAAAVAGAAAAVCAIPAAAAGFGRSAGALAWSAPFFVAATVAALAKRRGAACALLAACAWAAVPFFAVQGQEKFVGLWSLRRSLPPVVLCSVAAACAALEGEAAAPERAGVRWRAGALVALAVLCAVLQTTLGRGRLAFVPPRGDSEFFGALLAKSGLEAPEGGGRPLLLFDSFRLGAPFAAGKTRGSAFCLADAVSRRSDPSAVARWLAGEARSGRPVYVAVSREIADPVLEEGFSLVPDGEAVRGVPTRTDGKSWGAAARVPRETTVAFLRVEPFSGGGAASARPPRRHALDFSSYDAFPFGLRGGWAPPRRGKPGRWAARGAGFVAPVPPPGGETEIEITAAWTPPEPGARPQTLRLVPPFPAEGGLEATLAPGRRPSVLRFRVRRAADPAGAPAPAGADAASGVWKIESGLAFDAPGFPPRLAAQVFRIESSSPR